MVTYENDTARVKLIKPRGNILNDNDSGVDYLGHSVYAEALSHKIEEVSTPITIGIFAKWGSGKSSLLNHVKDLLSRKQRQNHGKKWNHCYKTRSWICRSVFRVIGLLIIVTLIVLASLCAASPKVFIPMPTISNNSSNNENLTSLNATSRPIISGEIVMQQRKLYRYVFIAFLLVCLLFVFFLVCGNKALWSSQFFANFRLISYAAFTELPIKCHQSSFFQESNQIYTKKKDNSKEKFTNHRHKRFIFVNFNAWQYTGSDTLWAGIVTNLTNAIENEFGSMTSRLFRMLSVNAVARNIKRKESRFFVKFPQLNDDNNMNNQENSVEEIMKSYGVVRLCIPYSEFKTRNKRKKSENKEDDENKDKTWWVVQFSTPTEAKRAKESLCLNGIEANFAAPKSSSFDTESIRSSSCDANSYFSETNSLTKKDSKASIENDKRNNYQNKDNFTKHFLKHPKTTCHIPNLFLWILILIFAVVVPIVAYSVLSEFELDVFRTGRAVPVTVQILSWLPASVASSFVIFNLIWAMFHSQRSRIMSALDGAKGAMSEQMGIMDKVKKEVEYITKLIKCAEFTHNKQYKVIIFIDDLDRIALDKMKSILEAVNILLSDRSSPFVCLIAVDSRVAVKCIEENLGSALLGSGVSGHEYLKKIINLPFCLPEISDEKKKLYFEGLVDLADETTKQQRQTTKRNLTDFNNKEATLEGQNSSNDGTNIEYNNITSPVKRGIQVDGSTTSSEELDVVDAAPSFDQQSNTTSRTSPYATPDNINSFDNDEDFLFECRSFICDNHFIHRHLYGNPRNIKRIFNVISMTSWLIHCHHKQHKRTSFLRNNSICGSIPTRSTLLDPIPVKRTKELAEDLVIWILLTDQWPYRISYLLQVIEDSDKRSNIGQRNDPIDEEASLLDIYEKFIQPEIKALQSENNANHMTSLDVHPDMFYCFLKELNQTPHKLNKEKAKILNRITVNLDHGIRHTIIRQREVAYEAMSRTSETKSNSMVLETMENELLNINGANHAQNDDNRPTGNTEEDYANSSALKESFAPPSGCLQQRQPAAAEILFPNNSKENRLSTIV